MSNALLSQVAGPNGKVIWKQNYPTVNEGFLWRTDFMTPGIINSAHVDQYVASKSGTGAFNTLGFAPADQGHPGIQEHQATAVADAAYIYAFFNNSATATQLQLGGGRAYFEGMCRVPVLSDGVNNHQFRMGFGSAASSADEVDGAFLELDRNGNATANWFMGTANNSVRTRVDTGIAPVANTWYRLRVDINDPATVATFTINGRVAGTITTNIPAAGRAVGAISKFVKKLGAALVTAHSDYMEVGQTFLTAR